MNILTYKGKSFSQRENDGYINLGELCATHGKRFSNWKRLKYSDEYMKAVAETLTQSGTHILTDDLITLETNEIGGDSGTYGHPLLAIEVARWISPHFGVWCNIHIFNLMNTGRTQSNMEFPDFINKEETRQFHEAMDTLNSGLPTKVIQKDIDEYFEKLKKTYVKLTEEVTQKITAKKEKYIQACKVSWKTGVPLYKVLIEMKETKLMKSIFN